MVLSVSSQLPPLPIPWYGHPAQPQGIETLSPETAICDQGDNLYQQQRQEKIIYNQHFLCISLHFTLKKARIVAWVLRLQPGGADCK